MENNKKVISCIYGAIALLALVLCWSQNFAYFHLGLLGGTDNFIRDLFANAASRSIIFDISFFFASASVWMVLDSRKWGIKHVWAYILFGLLIAISVTFPLYLIARQKKTGEIV